MLYNASAYEAVKDERIQNFLRFVSTNKPDEDAFSKKLSDTVERLKEDEIFRRDYAAMNLHDRDIKKAAKTEGILEGMQQQDIEDAKNFYANGASIELIAKSLKMTEEEVQKIVDGQPA